MFNKIINLANEGKSGKIVGIPHGFNRLSEFVPSIQKKTSYLCAAESSAGKSSFVNDFFVYNPIDWLIDNPNSGISLKIFYYSLEVPEEDQIAKAMCRFLWNKYKILIDIDQLLYRSKFKLSDEIFEKVKEAEDYIKQLYTFIEWRCSPANPTAIYKEVKAYMESPEIGQTIKTGEYTKKYVEVNPNHYVIVITDHISLLRSEMGLSVKGTIDKFSEMMVEMRNHYSITPVLIAQFNRGLASAERQMSLKNGKVDYDKIKPSTMDLKDSGNPAQDSHIIFGLFSPHRYEIPEYRGMDITQLNDRSRCIFLLKNRNGIQDIMIHLLYLGEVAKFYEAPKVVNQEYYLKVKAIKKFGT